MSRNLPASTAAALSDAFIIPVIFAEMLFDDAPLRVHSDLGTIISTDTSPEKTWLGAGGLVNISSIEETEGGEPHAIDLTLSGIDSTVLNEARNENYQERPCLLYFGVRNYLTGALLDNPAQIFYGFMDQMIIRSGRETSSVTLRVESEQSRWQRAPLKFYDTATLQADYAGDTFFNFLEDLLNKQLRWGTENPNVDLGPVQPRLNPASLANFF